MKSFILGGWLFLLTVFLAEQSIIPVFLTDLNPPASSNEPFPHYTLEDPLGDFFLLPGNNQQNAPAPVIREPLFKWKSFLPGRSVNPYSALNGYPELVQDIWRCSSVAIVLFPYHEFL